MAGENHFEIYPERDGMRSGPREPTGQYMFRFVYANGDVGPVSMQRYRDRTDANRGIHDFMSAINRDHPHPPIIDVEE
jgi:uncharacterized protein YegP (UPF0339 family)